MSCKDINTDTDPMPMPAPEFRFVSSSALKNGTEAAYIIVFDVISEWEDININHNDVVVGKLVTDNKAVRISVTSNAKDYSVGIINVPEGNSVRITVTTYMSASGNANGIKIIKIGWTSDGKKVFRTSGFEDFKTPMLF